MTAGLKSFIPSHSPRERREAYPGGEGVVVGGGTTGGVFEEDYGDPDGRMRDGESEEAAIALQGRKEGGNMGNVTCGQGEKGVGKGGRGQG